MCFSAIASFSAGTVLLSIGSISMRGAMDKKELAFLSIPFLFGFQQICEGFVWLSLQHTELYFLNHFSSGIFLIIAQVIWPFWVSLAIWLMEDNLNRKYSLKFLLVGGILVGVFLAYRMLTSGFHSVIEGKHIVYQLSLTSSLTQYLGISYMIVTVFPPFLSSKKNIWLLGLFTFLSYLITKIFYTDYVISVWCFFASLISILILFLVRNPNYQIIRK